MIPASALCSGVASSVFWFLLPVTLSGYASSYSLDEQQIGLIASSFGGGYFLASILGLSWVGRVSVYQVYRWGALGAALCLTASMTQSSAQYLAITLVFAGLCLGSVYSGSLVSLGVSPNPTRAYALLYLIQTGLVFSALLGLASLVPDSFPVHYAIELAAAVLLGALFVASLFAAPTDHRRAPRTSNRDLRFIRSSLLPLVAVTLTFAGFTGTYVFLDLQSEQFGEGFGFIVVAANLGAGAVGSLAALLIGARYGLRVPMIFASIMAMLSAVLMGNSSSELSFLVGAVLHGFSWNLGAPYRASVVAQSTDSGHGSVLTSGMQSAGDAIGPALIGATLFGFGWAYSLLVASAFWVIGLGFYLFALRGLDEGSI
ncbi:MAG: MFS transporter [Pseudomonadota bacterium]